MKIIISVKEWYVAYRDELLGFAVGMVFVLASAGLYRLSWELPESTPALQTTPTAPKATTTVAPSPARTQKSGLPVPQRPQRARPVLKKLDGPPEALRRLHDQQNSTNAP